MSAGTAVTVAVPDGCKHYQTIVNAQSWEAWDALTEADGWIERSWHVLNTKQCSPEEVGATLHLQKECRLAEGRLTAFPPLEARP